MLLLGATASAQTLDLKPVGSLTGRVATANALPGTAVSNLAAGAVMLVGDNPSNAEFAYLMTFDLSNALGLLQDGATVTLELETNGEYGANGPAPAAVSVELLGAGMPSNTGELYVFENDSTAETRAVLGTIAADAPRSVFRFELNAALAQLAVDAANPLIVLSARVRDTTSAVWSNGAADQLRFLSSGTRLIIDPVISVAQDGGNSGRVDTTGSGQAGGALGNMASGAVMLVGDRPDNQEFAYLMAFDLTQQLGLLADGASLALSLSTNGEFGANGPAAVAPTVSFLGFGPKPTDRGELYAYENSATAETRIDLGTIPADTSAATFNFSMADVLTNAAPDAASPYAFLIVRVRDYSSELWSNGAADQTRLLTNSSKLLVDPAKQAPMVAARSGRVDTTGAGMAGGAIGNLASGPLMLVGDRPDNQEFAFIMTFDASAQLGSIAEGNPVTMVLGPNGQYGANGPAPVDLNVDFLGAGPLPADNGALYAYENAGTVESRVTVGTIPAGTLNRDYYFDLTEVLATADISAENSHLIFIVRARDYSSELWSNGAADQTRFDTARTALKVYGGGSTLIPVTFAVETQHGAEGIPFGYQDLSDGAAIDPARSLQLSGMPYIDYMVAANSGDAGIAAAKQGAAFISIADHAALTATSASAPWQAVFSWNDGEPGANASDHAGVSLGEGVGGEAVSIATRVDLLQDGTLSIYHWWQDRADYGTAGASSGHLLTIERYNASDELVDTAQNVFTGGELGYFTTVIRISRDAAGDYLIIRNSGRQVGYAATAVAGPQLAQSFAVQTLAAAGDSLPYGYQDLTGAEATVDPFAVINLSRAPVLDYLVPVAVGSPAVGAAKQGATFIHSTTLDSITGSASADHPLAVVFNWNDGEPQATADDYRASIQSTADGSATVELLTRVDLLQDGPLQIQHWWSDSWDYVANPALLSGHTLRVSLYDADGVLKDEFAAVYGDAGLGVYATVIDISREADGDYLMIHNRGHQLGYSGTLVAGPKLAQRIHVDTQVVGGGNVPFGYQNFTSEENIDPEWIIDLSSSEFVDYMIPKRSGAPGIRAKKIDAPFLTQTTVESFTGGTNSSDAWQVVFAWSDATPTLAFSGFYGVSWSGWDNTIEQTLLTRVDLATSQPVTIYHWWNDGWNYANPSMLPGQILNVSLYNAADELIDVYEAVYGSGYHTSIIGVTRSAPGDYLLITNTGHNVGYKGTAVAAVLDSDLSFPQKVSGIERENGWLESPWLGYFYEINSEWIYHVGLGHLFTGSAAAPDDLAIWSWSLEGWLWTSVNVFPAVFDWEGNRWLYLHVNPDGSSFVFDFSADKWEPLLP
jgi:hypothetical protein